MNFYEFCKFAAPIQNPKTLGAPGSGHTRQPEADRWVPWAGTPGPSQGRPGGLEPGRAHAHGAARARRDARDAAAPANGGTVEAGPERQGEARTGRRRWRRASPAGWTAGNGGGRAARRAGAAADRGERRRRYTAREEAGLGVEWVEEG